MFASKNLPGARRALAPLIAVMVALGCTFNPSPSEVRVVVDTRAEAHPIDPKIYGISKSGGAAPYFKDLRVSVVRWGGNARSRFNWEINASNAGADWHFSNLEKGNTIPGSAALEFHARNSQAGAESLLSIPMIGWVAKDRNNGTRSLDVPASEAISGYDPAPNRERTSIASFARKDGELQYPPNLGDRAVYQDEWLHYITGVLGTAGRRGIRFYEMDNEPMLWSDTHVDIHPSPTGYDDYMARFLDYAGMVRDVDPTAQILGPSVWGWQVYFFSAADEGGDNYRTAPDRSAHGGLPFVAWFLNEVREYDSSRGRRSLDYLAVHYYPQGGVFSDDTTEKIQAKRLRSTRSLWDPSYKDESWIARSDDGPYVQLIPRLRSWIDTYYPGTKLAITEWNWGGGDHVAAGLAAADVLGIFGREGVDLATLWGGPKEDTPVYWAFRIFRNYDGQGRGFGDISVKSESSRPGSVSAYGSIATDTRQLKLVLINKMAGEPLDVRLELLGALSDGEVSVYQYTDAMGAIRAVRPAIMVGTAVSYRLPAYSMTMMITDLEES